MAPLPPHPVFGPLLARAAATGLNLQGLICAESFDRFQPPGRRAVDRMPAVGTILLLGHGGSTFWNGMIAAQAARGELLGEPDPSYHPVQEYTATFVEGLVADLGAAGIRVVPTFPDDADALNFLQLAECAGWGTISPVMGMLLHRQFGPWVGMRAALLIEGAPFGALPEVEEETPFEPCLSCAQPCVSSCPVEVFGGFESPDYRACAEHRHGGGCGTGCASRAACPVGADMRYGAVEEEFRHAYSGFMLRDHFGAE